MKLSIITINYNNKEGLKRTAESVKRQRCKDFEYIVVDGDSSDGSKEVMQEYADTIDIAISEKDTGIYNAMNKGVKVAQGEFLLFLNSGDWLNSTDVTEVILSYLTDNIDILSGYVLLDGENKRYVSGSPKSLTLSSVLYTPLSHQGVFIRKDLLKNRPYKENYRIVSDWIFSLETLVFDNPRYQHIDFDIAVYNTEGVSSNDKARINETELFLSSFMSAQTVLEISSVPSEIYTLFRQIPDSYKFKTICVRIIKFLFNIYIFLKPKALHKCDLPCIYINNTAVTDSEKIRFNNL